MNPWRFVTQIADIYLADEFELTEFEGNYNSDELRFTYRLVAENSNLFLKHENAPENLLESVDRDKFRVEGTVLAFDRNKQDEVTGLTLSTGRAKGIRFVKEEST